MTDEVTPNADEALIMSKWRENQQAIYDYITNYDGTPEEALKSLVKAAALEDEL